MSKPKTYKHTRRDGTIVRGTVPEDPKPEDLLIDALRENLSPEAVAAIASWLQPATVADASVNQEIGWFRGVLIDALGGYEQQNRLAEELGL
jgi:hypothetical protein